MTPQMLLPALVLVQLLSFCLFGVDKWLAIKQRRRIRERTLLASCLPLSALGGLLGMVVFHHKIAKPKFRYGVPAMLTVQLALALWALTKALAV